MMKWIGSVLFVLFVFNGFAHKHYVSITEIEWKAEKQVFQSSIKLTAHDFEHFLEDEGLPEIHIEHMKEGDEHHKKTMQLLTQHFRVYAGEEQCEIRWLGWEVNEEDELFLYIEFVPQSVNEFKEVTVAQNLLFAKFPAQQNIVHFSSNGQLQSETLIPEKTSATFELK